MGSRGDSRVAGGRRFDRRTLLQAGAAGGGSLLLPGTLGSPLLTPAEAAPTGTLFVGIGSDMTNIDPFLTNNDNATAETLTNVYGLPFNFKVPGPPVAGIPAANP